MALLGNLFLRGNHVQSNIINLCTYFTRKIFFYRARIHEMTDDNSEVKSVICIDKGTIEKVTKDDRIRPLYSQFRTNLENTLVPYKLSGVQVSNFFDRDSERS